jgi:glycosyltransferase involved in cell wall biosynthesis
MNEIIEVSICLPAYNQTKYLIKTLDSIVSQTFQNFELIISDDSTTDDVESIVNTYRNKFTLKVHSSVTTPVG